MTRIKAFPEMHHGNWCAIISNTANPLSYLTYLALRGLVPRSHF